MSSLSDVLALLVLLKGFSDRPVLLKMKRSMTLGSAGLLCLGARSGGAIRGTVYSFHGVLCWLGTTRQNLKAILKFLPVCEFTHICRSRAPVA
jgi:hypothetical protein